jgi:hypothetical protein
MKHIFHLLIFLPISIFSQESIETSLIEKTQLQVDTLVSINNFDTTFYISENILFKKSKEIKGLDIGYNNFQLGNITSVNTFNPLKINVFYKNFNTVVILDNRLAEIFKIDFNTVQPYKNISNVSTGFDNTLWVFNQDSQELELYDYKTNVTRAKTLPIQGTILDIKSSYNYCWLLTESNLYKYNYFGSLVKKIKNEGFTSMTENNENIILSKDNSLFYLKKDSEKFIPISIPNLLINRFFVTNETLYIYDGNNLYKLKIN